MPSSTESPIFWDDDPWDAFLVDDDELDPEPEPGDFWTEEDAQDLPFTSAGASDPLTARMCGEPSPC